MVEENPEEWMPWNYADTLTGLALVGWNWKGKRRDRVVGVR